MFQSFLTYKVKYPLILIITMFMVCSCSADDSDYLEKKENEEQPISETQDTICRVLIIGNSLARDAFSYVPSILEEICPGLSINMEIMYVSGNPLKTHWSYIVNESNKFVWDKYSSEVGHWTSRAETGAPQIVSSLNWDLVILQEGSVNARYYESTQPYVSNIVEYVKSIQPNTIFAYMIIPSLPDGAASLGTMTSDDVWKMNVETARQLLDEEAVGFLLPCGTAIQNARKTSLASFGYWGQLTYDGRHLQEGIPCLVDAYTAAESILKILSIDSSIEKSTIRVTQKWVYSINALGRHGFVLEGSDSDYELAKYCALQAIDYPYELIPRQ